MLISENFTKTYHEKFKKALVYITNNLINFDVNNEDKIKKLIDRTKIKKLEYRINLYCIKCLMFTKNSNRWKK